MKKLILKNNSIFGIYNLLEKTPFASKASRGRNKLQLRLQEKEKEFIAEKQEIQKKYIQLDEEGNFIVLEDGKSSPFLEDLTDEDRLNFVKEIDEVNNETLEISFNEYATKFEALFSALDNLETDLIGEDALAYDELMDAYEANESKKEEGK